MASSVDPDQTPRSVASDRGLHCFSGMSVRLLGVNTYHNYNFQVIITSTLNKNIYRCFMTTENIKQICFTREWNENYCPFDILWKDVFRLAFYSKWKCSVLIDNISVGTVCLFCFCGLFSNIYWRIRKWVWPMQFLIFVTVNHHLSSL